MEDRSKTERLRARYGWTQQELADELGLSVRTIQSWDYRGNFPRWLEAYIVKKKNLESEVIRRRFEDWKATN